MVPGTRGGIAGALTLLALLVYLLLPLLLIVLASLVATPLYHVRYLFTWAPAFLLMAGAVIAALAERRRALGLAAGALLALLAGFSLYAFWTDPAYAADDHRGAVAQLAAGWRPGWTSPRPQRAMS